MTLAQRSRDALRRLEDEGLRRAIPQNGGLVDFASNDYLGLSSSAPVLAALRGSAVAGSGGSRLLSGAHPEHSALEAELAAFVRRERCLLFSSGYLAALGALHSLSRVVSAVYSDRLNHACIIDAVRLTPLERHIVAHGELPVAEQRTGPAVIVTESLFGMSGTFADLGGMLAKMGHDDVLLVDEAHALGVFGPGGSGAASAYDDPRIVVLGTLSKAFGCAGGFVAGPAEFVELLVSTARSFIFDTSLPPPMVRAARAALRCIVSGDALRERLFDNVSYAGERLRPLGVCSPVRSPIVSVVLGEPQRAVAAAAHLRQRGLYAPAIRPPTVPPGTSRLRITLRADHRREEIDLLAAGIGDTLARGVAP